MGPSAHHPPSPTSPLGHVNNPELCTKRELVTVYAHKSSFVHKSGFVDTSRGGRHPAPGPRLRAPGPRLRGLLGSGHRQLEGYRFFPIVVDQHDLPAGAIEDRRGDRSPKTAGAVDPHLPAGHLGEAVLQFPERDVHGGGEVAGVPLVRAPHVEHDDAVLADHAGELGEADRPVARGLAGAELIDAAGRRAAQLVDADARQLPLGPCDLTGLVGDEGERRLPFLRPAEERGETVTQLDRYRAGYVVAGKRPALAKVDDPLSRVDTLAQIRRVERARWVELRGRSATPVRRSHL